MRDMIEIRGEMYESTSRLADRIGVHQSTIRDWRRDGKISGVKIGNTVYFNRDRVDEQLTLGTSRTSS